MKSSALFFVLALYAQARANEESSPGVLYFQLATMSKEKGGFGMTAKEAVDWISHLPKNVVFQFQVFEKNFKESGNIEKAVELTVKTEKKKEDRPSTVAEAKAKNGDFALLNSVKRTEKEVTSNPYDIKEYRGWGYGPRYRPYGYYHWRHWNGLGEYYYYEQRLTPKKSPDDEGGARMGVGVYFNHFR